MKYFNINKGQSLVSITNEILLFKTLNAKHSKPDSTKFQRPIKTNLFTKYQVGRVSVEGGDSLEVRTRLLLLINSYDDDDDDEGG